MVLAVDSKMEDSPEGRLCRGVQMEDEPMQKVLYQSPQQIAKRQQAQELEGGEGRGGGHPGDEIGRRLACHGKVAEVEDGWDPDDRH